MENQQIIIDALVNEIKRLKEENQKLKEISSKPGPCKKNELEELDPEMYAQSLRLYNKIKESFRVKKTKIIDKHKEEPELKEPKRLQIKGKKLPKEWGNF